MNQNASKNYNGVSNSFREKPIKQRRFFRPIQSLIFFISLILSVIEFGPSLMGLGVLANAQSSSGTSNAIAELTRYIQQARLF
jgi:hypothetical protein